MKGNKIMELVLIWFVLSILVGVFANNRGKSGILYFLFSIILSPLLGFLIALISGDDSKKKCSNCGQKIDINAKVCPPCQNVPSTIHCVCEGIISTISLTSIEVCLLYIFI